MDFKILFMLLLSWEYSCRCLVSANVAASEAKLIFYYGPKFSDSMVYSLSNAADILKNEHFVHPKTHLYLHGFGESQNSESVHVIVDAYLKRNNVNIVTLDWSKAAAENYFSAAISNINELAPAFADAILSLYKAGVKRENLEVVAHSLGAQLAGLTGRQVMQKTNGKVKIYRMAVLDAAFPLFLPPSSPISKTVNKNDVDFLQSIHTDIGTFGQPFVIGHVDFWPNGGRQGQPGCPQGLIVPLSDEDLCSHHRSWRFWAESVADPNGNKFLGFPSSSYYQFQRDGKDNLKKRTIEMGIDCPMNARGNYYLTTNSQSPFAKGRDGY